MGRLTYPEMIAEVAEHIAEHDAHGYSQPNRAGDGTVETITLSDGTDVDVHGGDYDCSEMARMCAAAAGVLPWDYWDSYMWTGNEYDVLTSHGFVCMDFDWYDVQRGDILLVSGHTGIALGDGLQADAHGDEYGGIDGPSEGDQTGSEIEIRDLKWYWTYTFRYVGPERPEPKPVDPQFAGVPINDAGIWYRAHVEDFGWLEPVHDGQVAGTTGMAKRMEAIKITPPEGWELYAKVHVQDHGWLTYEGIRRGESSGEGSSPNDPIIGTVGEARRVEDIIIGVSKRPNGDERKLRFQVHQQDYAENGGWKAWTEEGNASGTDGMAIRLEAIRIAIW